MQANIDYGASVTGNVVKNHLRSRMYVIYTYAGCLGIIPMSYYHIILYNMLYYLKHIYIILQIYSVAYIYIFLYLSIYIYMNILYPICYILNMLRFVIATFNSQTFGTHRKGTMATVDFISSAGVPRRGLGCHVIVGFSMMLCMYIFTVYMYIYICI